MAKGLFVLLVTVAVATSTLVYGDDQCTRYNTEEKCDDESPANLECVWVPKGYSYGDGAFMCVEKNCEALNFLQGMSDVGLECQDRSDCTWDSEAYFCYTAGSSIPCHRRSGYDDKDCGTGCVWNQDLYRCEPEGEIPCSEYYDEDNCPSSCQWVPEIYRCFNKGQVPCHEYQYVEKCPSYCDSQEIPGMGTYSTAEVNCFEKGEVMACEEYNDNFDGEDCPTDRCDFFGDPIFMCVGKGRAPPCEKLPQQACAESEHCKRIENENDPYDYACEDCPTTNCSEPYNGPTDPPMGPIDDGKPCNTHKGANCPEPRCWADWGETSIGLCSGGGTCRNATCDDLAFDSDGCKKLGGCTYDPDTSLCYEKDSQPSCDKIYEETECKKFGCEFDENLYICYPKGGHVPCNDVYDQDSCEADTDCMWLIESDFGECFATNSNVCGFFQKDDCPSNQGCDASSGICYKKGQTPPCSAFCFQEDCTKKSSCTWDTTEEFCTDKSLRMVEVVDEDEEEEEEPVVPMCSNMLYHRHRGPMVTAAAKCGQKQGVERAQCFERRMRRLPKNALCGCAKKLAEDVRYPVASWLAELEC